MILGLDPGGSTGCAWAEYSYSDFDKLRKWRYNVKTLGPQPHHGELWKLLHTFRALAGKDLIVVCESFRYRNAARPNLVLDSVEYIGIVKLFVEKTKTPLIIIEPGHSKPFVKDENLRRLGLYERGAQHKHERDALRVLLYHLTVNLGNRDILMQGWKKAG